MRQGRLEMTRHRFLLLLLVALAGCAPKRQPRTPTGERPSLRVMTYNVNYGLAGDEATMDAIAEGQADVVLLQETTPEWETALRERFASIYPHIELRHCCRAGGLAVLSKYRVLEEQYLEPRDPEAWFPGWRVVVRTPVGDVQVLNVHLRPPLSDSGSVVSGYFTTPSVRKRQIVELHEALDPTMPTLIVGDFNEASGGALSYLDGQGYHDALPQFAGPQDTWRWSTSVGTVRSQLDHIVYDDQLWPVGVEVLPSGRSDHLPLVGDFERRPRARPPRRGR